jgi:hypothetical protein
MRLIKLLAFFSLGYLIYEFYLGLSNMPESRGSGGGGGGRRQRAGARDLHRAMNRESGRMQNLTGGGRGETVSVEDSQGGRSKQRVGRGVVQS